MSRKKGTKKTGGREKGALNKQTAEIRQFVSEIVFENMNTIKTDISKLEADKRLIVLEKLLSYVLPKPQAAEFPIENGLCRVRCGSQSWVIANSEENETD